MKNNLAVMLRKAKHSGVQEGLVAMQNVCLIALDNTADEYLEEERIGDFLKATEKEMQRVWDEVVRSVGEEMDLNRTKMNDENSFTVAEWLMGWVDRIRAKRGME